MKTDDHVFVNGKKCTSFVLWQGSGSDVVAIECNTNDNCLHLYSVRENNGAMNHNHGHLKIVCSKTHNGFRYKCNGIGFKTKFNKFVLKIERI